MFIRIRRPCGCRLLQRFPRFSQTRADARQSQQHNPSFGICQCQCIFMEKGQCLFPRQFRLRKHSPFQIHAQSKILIRNNILTFQLPDSRSPQIGRSTSSTLISSISSSGTATIISDRSIDLTSPENNSSPSGQCLSEVLLPPAGPAACRLQTRSRDSLRFLSMLHSIGPHQVPVQASVRPPYRSSELLENQH